MIRNFLMLLIFFGCQYQVPKPNAGFALEYPKPDYIYLDQKNDCYYEFMHNSNAKLDKLSACAVTLNYPSLKAKLYITYFDLKKYTYDTLLLDFQKRLGVFGKKSLLLQQSSYENNKKGILGSCVTLIGNSPSNLHFFGTDKTNHFITGSLLFNAKPNYDSIVPAIEYVKTDVQRLLETLVWK